MSLVLGCCRSFPFLPDPLSPGTVSSIVGSGFVSSGPNLVRAAMLMRSTWLLGFNTVPIVPLRWLVGTWLLPL
jgi:hypothetical protein